MTREQFISLFFIALLGVVVYQICLIFSPFLRAILTFALPVAVMVSYPSKALLGMLSAPKIVFAFLLSGTLLAVSLAAWKSSLKNYCSVSS